MQKAVTLFTLIFSALLMNISVCSAATWVKLNENSTSKLMIDKQSILEKDKLKRAWVKIEYKTIQKNLESPDTHYNLSKLLWYFDCAAQKSAASQVFQYLDTELVHSAAINNIKDAKFIEPVPESDFDRAMRYVCTANKNTPAKPAVSAPTTTKTTPAETKAEASTSTQAVEPEKKPAEAKPTETKPAEKVPAKTNGKKLEETKKPVTWSYEGKDGPENWGKLSAEFSTCSTGSTQSPIDVTESIDANLKPLKLLQKFPAKEILQSNHSIQVNFKDGNIVAIDNMTFKLKQANIRTPSEHKIQGKSFPLEVQFLHTDTKGKVAIVSVLFKEGRANSGLAKIIKQLPNDSDKPAALKSRLLASEMIPSNQDYYRFSGSLTTPPCTEGINWVLIKTPMTASKEQLETLAYRDNNRPLQPINARIIVD
jgi:carbonic anhydrase